MKYDKTDGTTTQEIALTEAFRRGTGEITLGDHAERRSNELYQDQKADISD